MLDVKDDTHTSGSHFNKLCVEDFRAAIVSAMSDTFLIKMQNEGFCCFHRFVLIPGYKTTLNSFSNGSSPPPPFFFFRSTISGSLWLIKLWITSWYVSFFIWHKSFGTDICESHGTCRDANISQQGHYSNERPIHLVFLWVLITYYMITYLL